jgi:hypothetical protein
MTLYTHTIQVSEHTFQRLFLQAQVKQTTVIDRNAISALLSRAEKLYRVGWIWWYIQPRCDLVHIG